MTSDPRPVAERIAAPTIDIPTDDGPHDLAPIVIPHTLDELAARKRDAMTIVEARIDVLKRVRVWALRSTWPQDFVLFRSDDGLVIAYLEDAGCDRIRPYFGIEIVGVTEPAKTTMADGSYYYTIRAGGICKLTGEILEPVEGGRASTDDFVKHVTDPLQKDLNVRKAARASVDGIVVRTLAGVQSIAIEELREAWQGTTKQVDQCRKGRGFGTKSERFGGAREGDPTVTPPECPVCKVALRYIPAKDNRPAFYGCPTYTKHPNRKVTVDAAKWIADHTPKPAPEATAPDGAANADLDKEIDAADRGREPGQEG